MHKILHHTFHFARGKNINNAFILYKLPQRIIYFVNFIILHEPIQSF